MKGFSAQFFFNSLWEQEVPAYTVYYSPPIQSSIARVYSHLIYGLIISTAVFQADSMCIQVQDLCSFLSFFFFSSNLHACTSTLQIYPIISGFEIPPIMCYRREMCKLEFLFLKAWSLSKHSSIQPFTDMFSCSQNEMPEFGKDLNIFPEQSGEGACSPIATAIQC